MRPSTGSLVSSRRLLLLLLCVVGALILVQWENDAHGGVSPSTEPPLPPPNNNLASFYRAQPQRFEENIQKAEEDKNNMTDRDHPVVGGKSAFRIPVTKQRRISNPFFIMKDQPNTAERPMKKDPRLIMEAMRAMNLPIFGGSRGKTGLFCNLTAGTALVELWRTQRVRTTRPPATTDVYAFPWHEYTPTVVDSQHHTAHPNNKQDDHGTETPQAVLRLTRYLPIYGNPYEGFHALLTAFVVMKMLHLTPNATQIVFLDKWNASTAADRFLWSALSDFPTLSSDFIPHDGIPKDGMMTSSTTRTVTITSTTSTSLLCAKDAFGILRGRGEGHSCSSPLFSSLIEAIRAKVAFSVDSRAKNDDAVQVIWVQRRGKVARKLHREEEFVALLQTKLNNGSLRCGRCHFCAAGKRGPRFNVKAMDFASMEVEDIINTVSSSTNALVGIHGAGLMFGSFLKQRHNYRDSTTSTLPLLIELFGKNRQYGNKHYQNAAILQSIPYKFVNVGDKFACCGDLPADFSPPDWFKRELDRPDLVQWGEHVVNDIVNHLFQHFCR